MCRDNSKGEIFLDVLPGYLQIDYNVATCFGDIGRLLRQESVVRLLGLRISHLFSSCIHSEGKIDHVARQRHTITCSHVVLELFKALLSISQKVGIRHAKLYNTNSSACPICGDENHRRHGTHDSGSNLRCR